MSVKNESSSSMTLPAQTLRPTPDHQRFSSSHTGATANAAQVNGDIVNEVSSQNQHIHISSIRRANIYHGKHGTTSNDNVAVLATNSLQPKPQRAATRRPHLALTGAQRHRTSRDMTIHQERDPSIRKSHSQYKAAFLSIFIGLLIMVVACVTVMLLFTHGGQTEFQTPHIYHGFFNSWLDHDRIGIWKWQITVSTSQASWISGFLLVLLTLSIHPAYLILNRVAARFTAWLCTTLHDLNTGTLAPTLDEDADETSSLLSNAPPRKLWACVQRVWVLGDSPHSHLLRFHRLALRQDKIPMLTYAKLSLWIIGICVFCFILFIALVVSVILSLDIVSNSPVLSASPGCGLWVRDSSIKTPSNTGYDYLQEKEAGDYAKNCYQATTKTSRRSCNSFVAKDFHIDVQHNTPCPFDETICLDGKSSGITISAIIPSKLLGINVPTGYFLKRTTVCTPLKRRIVHSEDKKWYYYNYGTTPEVGSKTWRSLAEPLWQFPGYNVATFYWKQNTHKWQPSEEFRRETHNAITLLLVQSQRNYHITKHDDPIFPAATEIMLDPQQGPLYYNNDTIATALACVDEAVICRRDNNVCFKNILNPDPELPGHVEEIGYYMLLLGLIESTIFNNIQLRGGRALIASDKVEREISLPLLDEQWKLEVENLFLTSLARIQITLKDYLRGTAAGDPEYKNRMSAGMGQMCRMYKMPSQGWRNISVSGIIIIVVVVVFVYILALEVRGEQLGLDDFEDLDSEDPGATKERLMWILVAEWLIEKTFSSFASRPGEQGHLEHLPIQNRVSANAFDLGMDEPTAQAADNLLDRP